MNRPSSHEPFLARGTRCHRGRTYLPAIGLRGQRCHPGLPVASRGLLHPGRCSLTADRSRRATSMYVSVRDDTVEAAGFGTLLEGLRAMGINSIELSFGRDRSVASLTEDRRFPLATTADAEAYRRHLAENGVSVSALLVANNFGAADPNPEIAWCVDAIRGAVWLGAPAIRADTIMRTEAPEDRDARVQRYTAALREVLRQTEGSRVAVGMENHGAQGNDPEFLTGVLQAIPDPRLGLTLDTGNFYGSGQPHSDLYSR